MNTKLLPLALLLISLIQPQVVFPQDFQRGDRGGRMRGDGGDEGFGGGGRRNRGGDGGMGGFNRGGEGNGGFGRGGMGGMNQGGMGGMNQGGYGGRGFGGEGRGGFGGDGGYGRGGFGGGMGGGNLDLLRRLDANGNGLLEPSELNDRTRSMIERMGVSTNGPVSLDRLNTAMDQMRNGQGTGVTAEHSDSKAKAKEPSAPPLVPGFGEPNDLPPVAGFGEPVSLTAPAERKSGETRVIVAAPAATPSAGSATPAANPEDRLRGMASGMLKQYDKNGNGSLEKEEFANMPGGGERYDTNGDGVITLDELSGGLRNWGGGRRGGGGENAEGGEGRRGGFGGGPGGGFGGPGAGGGGPGGGEGGRGGRRGGENSEGGEGRRGGGGGGEARASAAASTSSAPSSATASRFSRYRTPIEKLPEGIPDWFLRDDSNGDGQVMMHEYASAWNDAKAAEFARYDINGDGVITPDEALKSSARR